MDGCSASAPGRSFASDANAWCQPPLRVITAVWKASRGEFHHDTALAKVGLHPLPAGAVILHEPGRVEYGLFQTRPRQRCLESRDMHVDVGVVRLERFINAVCCICYGRFAHDYTPVVVWLA
ncbi:hypothetical protein RL1129 [Rhizobium johnstonii 3841]|uniref:Uncharacterized protein n=1 Tax=Rhizobium johnstonii (strain DSM 114642 / LMG 32736 / 3841) TaxID=216596 RepID=Q1MK80_RHIJ3|nr:hypothetical protein RL1129 [Rhizobium johnstonii 3841]